MRSVIYAERNIFYLRKRRHLWAAWIEFHYHNLVTGRSKAEVVRKAIKQLAKS